jgi:DNA-directed RNA polymerase sigma subunit (sigma70/sigma32)
VSDAGPNQDRLDVAGAGRILHALNPCERAIVVMLYVDGKGEEEVRQALNVTRQELRQAQRKALRLWRTYRES